MGAGKEDGDLCPLPRRVDWTRIERRELSPHRALADYRGAMRLAGEAAAQRLRDPMLLSWYDRDGTSSPPSTPANAAWRARCRVM